MRPVVVEIDLDVADEVGAHLDGGVGSEGGRRGSEVVVDRAVETLVILRCAGVVAAQRQLEVPRVGGTSAAVDHRGDRVTVVDLADEVIGAGHALAPVWWMKGWERAGNNMKASDDAGF